MKRIALNVSLIGAAAMLAAACTVSAESGGPDRDAGCDPELLAALGQWADAGFSGTVAIDGGDHYCRAAFGLADAAAGTANSDATVFGIGSVGKAFTAAAVLDLVDADVFALGDRAGDLLPGLGGPAADVTVEQLLLHTGGIEGSHGADHRPLERDEAIAAISALESAFTPGTDYLYSNAGYSLLALIIDEQSGSSYREYLDEQILTLLSGHVGGFWDGEPAPAGPRAIGYVDGAPAPESGGFAGPHWAMAGNGDLAMTAAELGACTAALFSGEILSPDAVDLLLGTGWDHGDGTAEIPGWVSLEAELLGVPVIGASGGGGDTGHSAVATWLPETGTTVAIASNTDEVLPDEVLEVLLPALVTGGPMAVPDARADVDPAELQAREGLYALESGSTLTVAAEDDGLVVTADGADAVAAMFGSDDFTAEDAAAHEEAVRALLDGESAVGRAELDAIEAEIGPITGIELAGTTEEDGELHTYVRVTGEDGDMLAWYALDEQGRIAALEYDAGPPAFTLVPTDAGEYRPDEPIAAEAAVAVSFQDGLMTVNGPAGPVDARRAA
jgi:CubicO group peptidase (beta-lactamase class C family)